MVHQEPGAQKCDLCPWDSVSLAVQRCDFEHSRFFGCGQYFCSDHGYPSTNFKPLYPGAPRPQPKGSLASFFDLKKSPKLDRKRCHFCSECIPRLQFAIDQPYISNKPSRYPKALVSMRTSRWMNMGLIICLILLTAYYGYLEGFSQPSSNYEQNETMNRLGEGSGASKPEKIIETKAPA
mmetsp:Transcript_15750/g.24234  ORF Transcript_15750/g.24234 Transcript_15750/m.24234 type:complete len:180 (+) Transcript_15750:239-778(+)